MIKLTNVLEGVLCCILFCAGLRAIEIYLQGKRYKKVCFKRVSYTKNKIFLCSLLTIALTIIVYHFKCQMHPYQSIDILECIYVNPGHELARNVAIAVFINTTLFLGGLHQQLYNGGMKRKFMRFYKKQFQWNLFKKLFIVPLCLEIVFRALLCRVVDPQLQHPYFFTLLSGFLYALSHSVNYFSFRNKFGMSVAWKAVLIQIGYNFVFGIYVSHIFSKSSTLVSTLVLQGYANFMGYPQYFEVLQGNLHDDRVRKTALFYLCGVVGCLSCCFFM